MVSGSRRRRGKTKKRQPPTAVGNCRSCSDGACGPVSRIRSAHPPAPDREAERPSSIWDGRHRPSQAAYLHRSVGGQPCSRQSSGLGAAWPFTPWGLPGRSRHRERRCALTAPFHPLFRTRQNQILAPERDCSLLHVPSAPTPYGLARCSLPVRKHGALRCSDFPHRQSGQIFGLTER